MNRRDLFRKARNSVLGVVAGTAAGAALIEMADAYVPCGSVQWFSCCERCVYIGNGRYSLRVTRQKYVWNCRERRWVYTGVWYNTDYVGGCYPA